MILDNLSTRVILTVMIVFGLGLFGKSASVRAEQMDLLKRNHEEIDWENDSQFGLSASYFLQISPNEYLFLENNQPIASFSQEHIQFFANSGTPIRVCPKGGKLNEITQVGPIDPNFVYSGRDTDIRMLYNRSTKIFYRNVYPEIDLVFFMQENHLKYQFEIRPGGNPNQIRLDIWVTRAVPR